MDTPTRIRQLFQSIDAMDTDKFLTFLTDDAQFRFGNAPPAVGKKAVGQAVGGFFGTIKGISHRLINTWTEAGSFVCQGEATYTRHDGSQVTLPFVNVFGMNGDRIKDYLIYIDITPLYTPIS